MLALDGTDVIGPLVASVVTGVLALWLRRSLARHESLVRRERSVLPAPVRHDDFGLLVPVATCRDKVDADLVREHLRTAGIRSTLASGRDGRIRVLVFTDALDRARRLVG
jgi:hypothetical protein